MAHRIAKFAMMGALVATPIVMASAPAFADTPQQPQGNNQSAHQQDHQNQNNNQNQNRQEQNRQQPAPQQQSNPLRLPTGNAG
ncbi:hypothetical protein [Nocardia vaccinii]|uniref:hypothetical protein n=1 Tax=Nocardia vaccinii TaxID=1822 RepID=UPI00082B1756|nr:hypothetical protein [Nocardia vaccinii]